MYDVIIIGAGMSGLAAGIRLAHFGKNVCILEKHYTIGGLNSFYRLRGRDYDVGLHAVTNYRPKGVKKGPLARILRQLRFRWDDFQLCEQNRSRISFPDIHLDFDNDIELLKAEVAERFPHEADNFGKLLEQIVDYDDIDQELYSRSGREVMASIIKDPLLIEMLLCPLMWYGNAREHDMDFGQLCIMFRSIYLEGFARPYAGVRLILKHLVKRFRSLGGELKLRTGVERILVEDGAVVGVELENGETLAGKSVLSSAGYHETMRLCQRPAPASEAGRMTFCECISILDRQPSDLGLDHTIVFFNDSPKFDWQAADGRLCDLRTGVICSPNNFVYGDDQGQLPDGIVRMTAIADYHGWVGLPEERYRLEKLAWYDRIVDASVKHVPDFRSRVIDTDMFTPRTIHRFTWHDNGAVYGAPEKRLDGRTEVDNLYICGTDQGFVGIIGAMVSGISIVNQHLMLGT